MFYGSERFGTVRLEAERFGKLVMDCHETHKKHTKTLHFPDGVEQELAEITESARGKIFCHGKARKDAERSGFSNGMGGVTGATKAADTGLEWGTPS